VLGRLPRLQRLDKEPVTEDELEKSKSFSADVPAVSKRAPPKAAADTQPEEVAPAEETA
jgi:hypothetical protein